MIPIAPAIHRYCAKAGAKLPGHRIAALTPSMPSGTINVLQSKADIPFVAENHNLAHKIGQRATQENVY